MSTDFGKYEAVSEIFHSSRGGVFLGRLAGSKEKPTLAIKVFEPVLLPGLAQSDRDGARKFLEAVEAQRAATGKLSKHWIPILESGDFPGGAFYVTRHYSRSLEKLIDGRVRVSSETLVHLFRSLVGSLRQLQRKSARAHGNLKPSNVFVTGSGPLDQSRFLLADPAPASELDPKQGIAPDLKGLGSLLFRLVRRREVRGEIGWPITDSPDWDGLGAKGPGWLELCNQLLDPNVAAKNLTWDDLDRQLRGLRFRGARRRVFAITLGLPGLAALAGFLYVRFTPYERLPEKLIDYAEFVGNVPPDSAQPPPEWAQLCQAYYDWLGVMETALQDPDRRALWSRDAALRDGVLAKLSDAQQRKISLDPRLIAKVSGPLPALAAQPPEIVKKGAVRWHIQRAWKLVDAIHADLAAWPLPTRLANASDQLAKAGYAGSAAQLKQATPPTAASGLTFTTDTIDDDLRLAEKFDRAAAIDAQIKTAQETLAATRDPLLGGLVEYYRQPLQSSADLTEFASHLEQASQNLAPWLTFLHETWEKSVDQKRFEQESSSAKDSAPVSPERIARWQAEVRNYEFLAGDADPRAHTDWAALFSPVKHAVENYRTEEHNAVGVVKADLVSADSLQAEADALAAQVATFRAAPIIRKDLASAETQTQALAEAHRAFVSRVGDALVKLHPDVTNWLTWVTGNVFPESAQLQAVWQQRAKAILGDATAASLTSDPARFRTAREQARNLQRVFLGVTANAVLPTADISATDIREDFRRELTTWLTAQREVAVAALLNSIEWDGLVPRSNPDAILNSPAGTTARNTYERARDDSRGLAQDYTILAHDLAAGRGLDEGIYETEKRAQERTSVAALTHTGALGVVTASLEELHHLTAETDRTILVARVASGELSGAITAWRRLGSGTDWPASAAELQRELSLESSLRDRLAQADPDATRQARTQEEFTRESRNRWTKALRGATAANSLAEVSAVFSRITEVGLSEGVLDESSRYDLYLSELKTEMSTSHTADEATATRSRFFQRIQPLVTASARPEAVQFRSALEGVNLVAGNPSEDLKKLGPANSAWIADPAADASRVTFRWTATTGQSHELTFVLVDLAKNDPFFLATTEMPIGLFLDLIAAHPEKNFVATQMASWIPNLPSQAEDQRQGPQVWSVDFRQPGHLRINSRWTGVKMPSWPDKVYADGAIIRPPNRASPVQYIDPAAARVFAESILTCRLPTADEWNELIQVLGGADTLKKANWNLRDQTWRKQQSYLVQNGAAFDLPWPDADIFVPASLAHLGRGKDAADSTLTDDGALWFSDVNATNTLTPFSQLLGNVAEFLWDPKTQQYYVAGGSALSPSELEPTAISTVDSKPEREGYSDVGFRPAFSAPDSLVGKSRVSRLVRDQAFLRL